MKKVHGIGINDFEGKVSYIEGGKKKMIKSYKVWQDMLRRCYSEKRQKKQPTYKSCTVSKEWLLYSNFKKWFDENYPNELVEDIRFEIDKDLLVEGNKLYSKETCLFLPKKINSFMSNKYKSNKTGYIGVSFKKSKNRFVAQTNIFGTSERKHLGLFEDPLEASKSYIETRKIMAELAKQYMRDLGIYTEEIIDKIK